MKTLIRIALLGAAVTLSQSAIKAELDLALIMDAAPAIGDFMAMKEIVGNNWNNTVVPMINEIITPANEIIRITNIATDDPAILRVEFNNLRAATTSILNTLTKAENMALFVQLAEKLNQSEALKALLIKHLTPLGVTPQLVGNASERIKVMLPRLNNLVNFIMVYVDEYLKPK